MNQIQIPRQRLLRRHFLKLSGLSSVSLLLGGCGTPLFEDIVGKVSEPLNQKVETLIFNPDKLAPEFPISEIKPEALIVNSFNFTPKSIQPNFVWLSMVQSINSSASAWQTFSKCPLPQW